MNLNFCFCLCAGLNLIITSIGYAQSDLLIADFESDSYGQWETTGEAFGSGPAKGTLTGQMSVNGFSGQQLVNSFHKGDRTTGTLSSPSFEIQRDYITFLIGGGGHEHKTCINLLIDGKVLRTATGMNTNSGGSEQLNLSYWDVKELRGKSITIQIVDQAKGGWGHINIDHIVQTNNKPDIPDLKPHERNFTITKKYLVVPISNGAKKCELVLEVEGVPVRSYETELALDTDSVDWYAYFTIETYQNQSAKLSVNRATEDGFSLIRQSSQIPSSVPFYTEQLRPQFHFSQKVGWNNDPNGMVYLNGEWHLFFQHNPVGWNWGNMTWGHAVSKDLVHWEQLPNVLFPKTMAQGACFSGGATIDKKNTAGLKKGDNDVLIAFLTDTGSGEAIAYSHDQGRSFTWHQSNPVLKHKGRDPKVIWYEYGKTDTPLSKKATELGGHWVMVVYDEHEKYKKNIAFFTSTDLVHWKEQSHLQDYYECPELLELPIDGDKQNKRWIVLAADAKYTIGKFDGKTFKPEHQGTHQVHHGSYYASQLFDNAPDDRKIQIGWVRIAMPGMPFNQTFSFPHQLSLRTTAQGLRMYAKPVKEIENLHKKKHSAKPQDLRVNSPVMLPVSGRLFDIRATFELGDSKQVGLDIGGNIVAYDVNKNELNGASMKPINGTISIQVLVDRPMIEICGNEGAVYITSGRKHLGDVQAIKAFAEGHGASLIKLDVYELESIWKKEK